MENNETTARLNHLTGNMMGLQALVLSIVATSGRRTEIANHFAEESQRALATFIGESNLPDDAIHHFQHWCETTVAMLMSDEEL